MSGRSRRRSKALRQMRSSLRYATGEIAFASLGAGNRVSTGAMPKAVGGVDYLINRCSIRVQMHGTAGVRPLMWAWFKNTGSLSTPDLGDEDAILDALASKTLYHVKGPAVWDNDSSRPFAVNAKLTDMPMRSADTLELFFQNVSGSSMVTGQTGEWAAWLSYQV